MIAFLRKIGRGLAWRWKYRFKLSTYRGFLDLYKGGTAARTEYSQIQSTIVEEILRVREGARGVGGGGLVDSISVVIPHYNQQRFLAEAIESVCQQSIGATEIIVVDDLSDDTASVKGVEEKFRDDPRVRFHYPGTKLYAGGARQFGLEMSTGDVVSFLDADDLMHPQRLEYAKLVLDLHPDCQFVITCAQPFYGETPEAGSFSVQDVKENIVLPSVLARKLARNFSRMRLSWIDPSTREVPWYAWGSFGIHGKYQPNSGSFTIRRECSSFIKWSTPKAFVFTPYEDYEYCLLLHAATRGGYQIDLPLMFYRKGSTTNHPSSLV